MLLATLLTACADDGGPSFAPDAGTETAVSALTPQPTATQQSIQRQPGELEKPVRTLAELAAARGGTASLSTRDGASLTIYDTSVGHSVLVQLPDPVGIVATASGVDGATVLILRRDDEGLTLDTTGLDGIPISSLSLPDSPGAGTPAVQASPLATPLAASPASAAEPPTRSVTRDRLELSPGGTHAAVVSAAGDLTLLALGVAPAPPSIARVIRDFGDVTALAWSSDGSLAIVATYDQSRSAGSLTGVPLEGRLRPILRLAPDDRRRVIAVAAPAASTELFFVLRSDDSDFTAQNNLYRIPLAGGTSSVVVATGLVGPAGAVDRLAVADDGLTVAVTILVPRDGTLSLHSVWVADVRSARPQRVETGSLGLVSRVVWTPGGLFVVGVQRERSESASRLVTVALRLAEDGTLVELGRSASEATPVASPVASPASASPISASPVASAT